MGVALVAAVVFVTDALRAEAERGRVAAPDLVVQSLVGGRPALVATADARAIAALPGVARVTARVWGYVFVPSLRGNVAFVGASSLAELRGARLVEGRVPLADERGACVLGRELARALGVRVGDRLRVPTADEHGPELLVSGLFAADSGAWTADVALVAEADARRILGTPLDRATDLAIDLANPDESRVVALAITKATPTARVIEKRLLERVHALAFGRRAGLVLGASIPALLALLVLAYDRASGLGPGERREIAILKACGWSTADVLSAKMLEALVVASAASMLGMLVAYGWAFLVGAPGLREVLAGWSAMYPSAALVPAVSLPQMTSIVALVTAPYVALSVVPSWRAAIADPMEVLREGLSRRRRARRLSPRGWPCVHGVQREVRSPTAALGAQRLAAGEPGRVQRALCRERRAPRRSAGPARLRRRPRAMHREGRRVPAPRLRRGHLRRRRPRREMRGDAVVRRVLLARCGQARRW